MTWELMVVAGSLWLAAGMTFASALYRRGHDGWFWLLVCGVAGPLAIVLLVREARLVEPAVSPITLGSARPTGDGLTVVVPSAAVGAVDARALDRLGVPVGRVVVVSSAAYEHLSGAHTWTAVRGAMDTVLAEATQCFHPLPVELVVLPGTVTEAVVDWAASNGPAMVVTTRGAHNPRTLGRLARSAGTRRGVSFLVLDPTAFGTVRERSVA